MHKVNFLVLPILWLFISTHSLYAQNSLPFSWLEGTWVIQNNHGKIVESWKRLSDSTLVGRSVMVKNLSDTTLLESLQVSFLKGNWYYRSSVEGQNNNTAVNFQMVFLQGEEFIVENVQHDFPTRIAYRRVGNYLYASIEGRKGNKIDKRNFDYVRVD